MIRKNRLFERKAASRSAKSIYIFCEGAKREYQYFNFFKEIDSRVNIEVYQLSPNENNSPSGLLEIAKKCILKNKDNPNPKYDFWDIDEVWIVYDRDPDAFDSRKSQIAELIAFCEENRWNSAQSNPCFEVWLYYHFYGDAPASKGDLTCNFWKNLQNSLLGGFDSRKHPIFIADAVSNADANFEHNGIAPNWGATEVSRLGKTILEILGQKIERARSSFDSNSPLH